LNNLWGFNTRTTTDETASRRHSCRVAYTSALASRIMRSTSECPNCGERRIRSSLHNSSTFQDDVTKTFATPLRGHPTQRVANWRHCVSSTEAGQFSRRVMLRRRTSIPAVGRIGTQ